MQIRDLAVGSQILEEKLKDAKERIERNDKTYQEEKSKLRISLFIAVPVLLIVPFVLAASLFLLLRRYRIKTEFQINALRKYTYEELDDVKAGYMDEIKRRVKKVTVKLKPSLRKEKQKSKLKKSKSIKENQSKGKGNQAKS